MGTKWSSILPFWLRDRENQEIYCIRVQLLIFIEYKEGSLNKSYNPQLPRNISESGTALKNLPRTLDIYS